MILSVSKRNGPQPPPSHIKPITFGNELRTYDMIPNFCSNVVFVFFKWNNARKMTSNVLVDHFIFLTKFHIHQFPITIHMAKWSDIVHLLSRYLSAISLYGRREKRALEALLVSFPTVRTQKPTTGILVSASKQKRKHTAVNSRFPTVSSFSLASLHTSRTNREWNGKNPNLRRLVQKTTERFPSCAGGKRH